MNDTSTGPGLLRKAANFSKAVAKHVADGGKHVTDEVYLARLSVCANCPALDPEKMRCKERLICGSSSRERMMIPMPRVPSWPVRLVAEVVRLSPSGQSARTSRNSYEFRYARIESPIVAHRTDWRRHLGRKGEVWADQSAGDGAVVVLVRQFLAPRPR